MTSVGVVVNKEIHVRREKSQCDEATLSDISPRNGVCEETKSAGGSLSKTLNTYLRFSRKASEATPPGVSQSAQRYLDTLELAPGLKKLLGDGKLVDHLGTDNNNQNMVHTASDYSYSSDRYSGDGWRIIGDAGGG